MNCHFVKHTRVKSLRYKKSLPDKFQNVGFFGLSKDELTFSQTVLKLKKLREGCNKSPFWNLFTKF